MDYDADELEQRSRFLSVALTVLGASVFLFVLFVACGGLLVYIVAVVAGLGIFGLIHYLLWGHALSAQMTEKADEDAEDARAERADPEDDGAPERRQWTPEERSWYRRF
jgi:hypothetical protein